MKLKSLSLLFFLFFFNYSFSCDCPPHEKETMVQKGLNIADIVFYGELIKIDTIHGTFDFRIIELFKGKYHSKIIQGKNSTSNCDIDPFKKDLWIVYANLNKDKTINLSSCLPSQTMDIPAGFLPPIPILKMYGQKITKLDSIANEVDNLKISNRTIMTFFYQLEQLRAFKASQNKISEKPKTELKAESYNKYILISLIINIILFLVLLFIVFRKRKI